MTTRYLIAAALMATACAAHADVLPVTSQATVVNGTNVAGALGDASLIAGVSRGAGSEAMVQALYDKVSAAVGNDMKVSLKQGLDGVYVQGLSTAKAAALAGDGMSVINTSDGFKVIQAVSAGGSPVYVAGSPNGGGGAAQAPSGTTSNSGNSGSNGNSTTAGTVGNSGNAGTNTGLGSNASLNAGVGNGTGNANANGDLALAAAAPVVTAAAVPEPSTVFLMLAGMLGVVGIRRRAR